SIAGHLWIKMRSKNRTKLDLLKAQLQAALVAEINDDLEEFVDSNNEDNEFDEDEFGAAFVQSLQNE
ncbi:17052_t:CDS:2, partial [Entrophospora sp. SA101]